MSATDASTDADTASASRPLTGMGPVRRPEAVPARGPGPVGGPEGEDTLDLRLPEGFTALYTEEETSPMVPTPAADPDDVPAAPTAPVHAPVSVPQDTGLVGQVADWGPTSTPVGAFHLLPVRLERDLRLLARWMNDPTVAVFWQLAGDESVTGRHVRAQLAGDGRSVPCLGVLDGTPMSYWEVYRADLDPLARHYPARPHDIGIHLLIGEVSARGRGLGSALLRAVADLALDRRPACARVVAEPDLRNTPSIAAFLGAGFRLSAEVDLPGKRAALMIRDRILRHLL
ncbi:GNAT family N-acetyltransferase [Streptomyces sp. NPDC052040]|uniref:GNAT family N-acetyltransferase n=1 Tax=Streptomyces sp. NPDC052040 TaxID=3365682 RepID=UPI0037D00B65